MLAHRGAEVEAQHAAHLLVERLQQVGLALASGLVDELLVGLGHVVGVVGIGAAHGEPVGPRAELHVESVEDGFLGVVAATPVAHHDAVELPVALQNLVEHHAIMTIVLVVVEVVGTHDAPGLALGDGGTEGGQIDFVQCAVAHHDVHLMAILLVVVQRVVLHAGRHTLRLQSLHVGHHHARGQPRVLAHVLEVAAGQRRAVDVDARTQYHVLAAIARFLAKALAVEACQVGIPRGSQTGECREGHARVVGLAGLHPLVPQHVGAHAVGAVVGPEVGHAQTRHACCREFRLRVDHAYFLVERHARQRVVDALLQRLRLVEIDRPLLGLCRKEGRGQHDQCCQSLFHIS